MIFGIEKEELIEGVERLERIIGETNVADRLIEEKWETGFMEELRKLSLNMCKRSGERGIVVNKGTYRLRPHEWTHARVLTMILILTAWMGPQWATHFRTIDRPLSVSDFIEIVREAFSLVKR